MDAIGGESVVIQSDGAVCTGASLCALPGQPEAPVSSQQGQAVFIDRIAGDWLLTANPYQFNLLVSGGTAFIPAFLAFATGPRKIRFNASGTPTDYVAAACQ